MEFYTDFYHILWFFIIYCVCGWIWESCYCSVKAGRWINRGFLMGPYIPIYGAGALLVYLTLYPFRDQMALVYLGGVIFPSALEFMTSWVMEKLFAARWWDYSHQKFNIQGRICLGVSLFWGVFSVIMVEMLHPAVLMLIDKIPRRAGQAGGVLFCLVFSIDFIQTVMSTLDAKKALSKMEKVREDIYQFLEVHNIGAEYKELHPSRMVEAFRDQWRARKEYFENLPLTGTISEYREELEEKLSALIKVYEENKPKHGRVLRHHMLAYPKLRSTKYAKSFEETMEEIKKHLEKLRKEK